MPRRDPYLLVDDILNAIQRILRYVDDMSYEDFVADEKTIDAVVRNFEIIGEAANNLPQVIRERHKDLPWSEMRSMRNVLAHVYWGVDKLTIWKTIHHNLPPLVDPLQAIMREHPPGTDAEDS